MRNQIMISMLFSIISTTLLINLGVNSTLSRSSSDSNTVTVYKSPTCDCCNKWVKHLQDHGFKVIANDTSELNQIKVKHKVPNELAACHTAIVDGYVVEGHVPADVIQKMLNEHPKAIGIAVPGMPMGSPGMEGSYSESYDVLIFDQNGNVKTYTSR